AHRREEPGLIDALLSLASTRVLLAHDGRFATQGADGPHGAERVVTDLRAPSDELVAAALPEAEPLFLGADEDGAYVALVLPATTAPPGAPSWANLREAGERLDARDAGLAATTLALASWHATHRFCPRCGAPTAVSLAGWQRRCTIEGTPLYPRTDPAVIMAVTDDDDRLLLGHATHWPARRFSTLAGFVEAGESAEQALRREVLEEVSLPVTDIEYRGSQTWPFPASLMLAYRARATATEIVADGVEVGEARWFDRSGLRAASTSGEVLLPGRASIARALIEDWFGGVLP
ncbi:MAG: NAD(+) diphosphatase, partial [Actinomycetota bacterium]|nr:NAD(+) diphosphatase [Actinomycetota bacterium]